MLKLLAELGMRLKSNQVSLLGVVPQVFFGLDRVEEVYRDFGREVTITSGSESTTEHSPTSLHYSGQAVDIRTQNPINGMAYFDDPYEVVRKIKEKLNHDFDVLYEEKFIEGKKVSHIHLEYQPRQG